jgi:hypothetical protein
MRYFGVDELTEGVPRDIQDAIERTRANLMIADVFPKVFDTHEYIRDALIMAAELNDQAMDIHRRLQDDLVYRNNMARIVSSESWISMMKVLTFYSASCTQSPFPQGSQGLLCCNCPG